MFKKKNLTYIIDTLYLKASSEEEAKEIALDTLTFIAENYMQICNMQIVGVQKTEKFSGTKSDYEVKVIYELGTKVKNEKDKYLHYGK